MNTEQNKILWQNILEVLCHDIPHSNFITFFRNMAILEDQGDKLVLGVASPFTAQTIRDKYAAKILEAAQKVEERLMEVIITVDGTLAHKGDPRVVDVTRLFLPADKQKPTDPDDNPAVSLPEGIPSRLLNPRYQLDNFIVGSDNQLAHAASVNVARNPGGQYNPLFIYGGTGLGKTHLLQGIGNEVLKRRPKAKVAYMTSEKFTNEVITAIRSRSPEQFRARYRLLDVLIIDDIQFLANKDQTQVEFFHTFNALREAGKQIVISSDRPPKELTLLEERLRSRFEGGMIVDVKFPDFETRVAILQSKCQERNILISNEVLEFIAHNTVNSVRELEGILNQTIALYELKMVTPTIKSVGELIKRTNNTTSLRGGGEERDRLVNTITELIDLVADYYRVKPEDIVSDTRRQDVVVPRQLVMYLAKKYLRFTYEKIGAELGGRLHSTVMYACNKLDQDLKEDRQLKRDINALKLEMGV